MWTNNELQKYTTVQILGINIRHLQDVTIFCSKSAEKWLIHSKDPLVTGKCTVNRTKGRILLGFKLISVEFALPLKTETLFKEFEVQ